MSPDIPVHEISESLGGVLPEAQALTGCDTASATWDWQNDS